MRNALRAMWRQYRSLPGRAQAGVAVAVVVAVVIAAAVGGPGSKTTHTLQAGSAVSSTTEASTTSQSSSSSTPTVATSPSTAAAATPSTTSVAAASTEGPGACHVRGSGLYVLPDPTCTPGATNPDVTQADIASTICASGWTATIRPPESYTEPLKIQQMAAYGETASVSYYEEDHLVSLELGGSARDPRNLWPEPGASPNPKDRVENAARRAVCDGQMSLAAAQQDIAGNWIALGEQLGVTSTPVPATVATTTGAAPPTSPPSAPAAGCSPTTSSGNCYKAGEYCPGADHGMTGTDANGNPITCKDVNGTWRWES